ncbi:hypothetical protein D049_2484A, partial [Vibrio parahaemolyticus VPTS-2010]|jgi:MFS family permease
MDC